MLFEDVSADLADAWLDAKELPEPPANIRSRRVQKIDHATGQVLHTYDCQADVQTKYKMSPRTLNEPAAHGIFLTHTNLLRVVQMGPNRFYIFFKSSFQIQRRVWQI